MYINILRLHLRPKRGGDDPLNNLQENLGSLGLGIWDFRTWDFKSLGFRFLGGNDNVKELH
jgi:hypothetical protein